MLPGEGRGPAEPGQSWIPAFAGKHLADRQRPRRWQDSTGPRGRRKGLGFLRRSDTLLDRGGGYAFALEEVEDPVPPGVEGAQILGGADEGRVPGLDRGRMEGEAE